MSTPAQLLAMKHADLQSEAQSEASADSPVEETSPVVVDSATTVDSVETDAQLLKAAQTPKKTFAMDDDEAFPVLGSGSSKSTTPVSWGPNSNGGSTSSISKPHAKYHQAVKSKNTQKTFAVDGDQLEDLDKAALYKVLSQIEKRYGVSIETNYSSTTNNRTFLLKGPPDALPLAKRDLLKRLTKPVTIEFTIPSALRSAVIGSQGKNIRPILDSTKVKVDIERRDSPEPEDDDILNDLLKVSIEGDSSGVQEAKSLILALVDEQLKDMTIRFPVDSDLKPFIANAAAELELPSDLEVIYPEIETKTSNILLSGSRDSVVEAKAQLGQLVESLRSQITSEDRSIPQQVHSLLDVAKILEDTGVLVKLPGDSASVKFVGPKSQIEKAITYAKDLCSDYLVDSLDLARSHGGNVEHAKSLTAYFVYTKLVDELSQEHDVKIHTPSYASLADDAVDTAIVSFICKKEEKDSLKQVRKKLVDAVNRITPNYVRVLTDIDTYVFPKLDTSVAVEQGVSVVPLGELAGFGNKLLLVVQLDDGEFAPSNQEVQQKLDLVESSFEKVRELSKDVATQVIAVDSKDQAHLSGKLLDNLLGKFDVSIDLHQNAEGPSEDEILARGFTADLEKAIDDINEAIDEVKNYEEASKYTDSYEFPTKLLSRLIGHNGNQLKELRDEFDCRIDVLDETEGDNTSVKLTGLKRNVDECKARLSELSKRWADEKTVILVVEPRFHRRMIGPGGVYVNRLQDRYHVSVRFPREGSTQKKSEVVIRGPAKGVNKAEEELKELLQFEQENGYTEKIKVPTSVLSRVIGKNGEQIKTISSEAGVSINSLHATPEQEKKQGYAEFEIVGSRAGIKKAAELINEIVDKVENQTTVTLHIDPKWHRYLIGPGGSIKRQIILKSGGEDDNSYEFRRFLQVPSRGSGSDEVVLSGDKRIIDKITKEVEQIVAEQENVITETIEVPKKKHRMIIGPGGSVRRSLEEEYKVNINIPRVNVETDDVKIKGAPDQVAKCKARIEQLTE